MKWASPLHWVISWWTNAASEHWRISTSTAQIKQNFVRQNAMVGFACSLILSLSKLQLSEGMLAATKISSGGGLFTHDWVLRRHQKRTLCHPRLIEFTILSTIYHLYCHYYLSYIIKLCDLLVLGNARHGKCALLCFDWFYQFFKKVYREMSTWTENIIHSLGLQLVLTKFSLFY